MNRARLLIVAWLVWLGIALPASAYQFEIDRLSIEIDGGTFSFLDEFDDGSPPPSPPAAGQPYAPQGTLGPESGGFLFLEETGAIPGTTGGLVQTAIQQRFTQLSSDISVTTTWNLLAHDPGERAGYGTIFVYTDGGGTINALVLLAQLDPVTGLLTVGYQEFNETSGVARAIDSLVLDPSGADQVELRLSQVGGSSSVAASFALLAGGSPSGLSGGTLGRAASLSSGSVGIAYGLQAAGVPEPVLVGLLGLAAAAFVARRGR